MISLLTGRRTPERTGARQRDSSPTKKDWRQFKSFYLSLYSGNDKEDLEELMSFLTRMHTTHTVSLNALDEIYKFFLSFSERLTKLKAKKKARKSYIHMRRKLLAQVPVVLSDILRVDTDGEEVEDKDQRKVYRDRRVVRTTSKISLESVINHVHSHPKHSEDVEKAPVSIDKNEIKCYIYETFMQLSTCNSFC